MQKGVNDMRIFNIFKKKENKQEAPDDDFNPLDINSVIRYIKKMKPGISDHEAYEIIGKAVKPDKKELEHLTADGDLPWGWFFANKQFIEHATEEVKYFYSQYVENRYSEPKKKYAALKSLLLYIEDAKKLCAQKGECFLFWFVETWAKDEEVKRLSDELHYIEEHIVELEESYKRRQYIENILIPDIKKKAIEIIKNNPGIIQTEIYSFFEPDVKIYVQDVLRLLSKSGEIKREKYGRTYKLTI